jgi:type I restriction enzyme S subunit
MAYKEVQLQDVLDVQWGDTKTTKASYVENGYVAYSATGPDGFLDKFEYHKDGVVLSAIGANCGLTFYAIGKWSCIKNTIRIFPKTEDIDLKYFYYMTKAPSFWPLRGSAQPFISQTDIREMYVRTPDVPTQKVIGEILYNIDEKIATNNQLSKTLEEIAQTIFKSWFIDFDPVKAKMAGEKPVGMDAATAALFPDSMEDSELGLIPKGWSLGQMGDIFSLQGGYAFKSTSWVDSGVPVIKIGSVKPGFVDLNQVSYVTEQLASTISSEYKLEPGSMVIGLTGYVGEVGLVRSHTPFPLVNQRVAKFKRNNAPWSIPFTYCLTRRPEFKRQIEETATGTAQQNVSNSQILGIPTVVPPATLIELFESIFESTFERVITLADESIALGEIRDSLLPRLISGELQIPEEMLAS